MVAAGERDGGGGGGGAARSREAEVMTDSAFSEGIGC